MIRSRFGTHRVPSRGSVCLRSPPVIETGTNWQSILAARSSIGTVNHTLLTLAALHAAELPVHGVVLIGDQNRENRETIERFGHVRVIGEIPRLPNLHRTALMQVFMTHFDRAAFAQ